MRRIRMACLLLLAGSLTSREGEAQSADSLPRQVVVIAVGGTNGHGGFLVERSGLALLAAGERTILRRGRVDLVGGVGYQMGFRYGSDLTCVRGPDGACAPVEPDLQALSGTLGARFHVHPATLAVRVGPDFYGTRRGVPNSSGVGLVWGVSGALMLTRSIGLTYLYDTHRVQFYAQHVRVTSELFGLHLAW